MKQTNKAIYRLLLLALLFVVLIFPGCEEKSTEPGLYQGPCVAGPPGNVINFRIIDKLTGKDLFFDPGGYQLVDLTASYDYNLVERPLTLQVVEDKKLGKYFYTLFPRFSLKISTMPKIDVEVTSKIVQHQDKCPTTENIKVEYNGTIETGIENKIIYIKVDRNL